jgi:hypothetical protein
MSALRDWLRRRKERIRESGQTDGERETSDTPCRRVDRAATAIELMEMVASFSDGVVNSALRFRHKRPWSVDCLRGQHRKGGEHSNRRQRHQRKRVAITHLRGLLPKE